MGAILRGVYFGGCSGMDYPLKSQPGANERAGFWEIARKLVKIEILTDQRPSLKQA